MITFCIRRLFIRNSRNVTYQFIVYDNKSRLVPGFAPPKTKCETVVNCHKKQDNLPGQRLSLCVHGSKATVKVWKDSLSTLFFPQDSHDMSTESIAKTSLLF